MQIIYLIIGAIIGLFFSQDGINMLGAAVGAAIGYLFGNLLLLKNKTKAIQEQLHELSARLNALQTSDAKIQEEVTQPKDDVPKDQYIQAAKDSVLERERSELTVPEEKPEQTPKPSHTPYSAKTAKSSTNQESAFFNSLFNLFGTVIGFFTTGNVLVKVGVVVLFFGFSFLVKLAVEHALFPIEYRLIAVALGGIAMLAFGWRLREKRSGYAVAIQGGGIGLLYLSVYASFRLYHLLPATA